MNIPEGQVRADDPQWRMLARLSGQETHIVVAIAWDLLCHAAISPSRLSIAGLDASIISKNLELTVDIVENVIGSMEVYGFIIGDEIRYFWRPL